MCRRRLLTILLTTVGLVGPAAHARILSPHAAANLTPVGTIAIFSLRAKTR